MPNNESRQQQLDAVLQSPLRQRFGRHVALQIADTDINGAALDLSTGGNRIMAHGQVIEVDAASAVAGATRPELAVSVASAAAGSVDAEPLRTDARSVLANSSETQGLSYDDQLFRTKWGWQAYDAARRAAFIEANGGSQR